jgi:hypothetical protein
MTRRMGVFGLALSLIVFLIGDRPKATAAEARVTRAGSLVIVTNGRLSVSYNLATGLADYAWDGQVRISNAYSGAVLSDLPDRAFYTFQPARRRAEERIFADAFGRGVLLEVTSDAADLDVALVQQIYVYDAEPFLTQRVSLTRQSADGPPVSTGQIEVLAASPATTPAGGARLGTDGDVRFYQAPFYNNDDFAVVPLLRARGALSYWLGGLIEAGGGPGLFAGAVETGRWKSAVWYDGPSASFSAHSGTHAPVDAATQAPVTGARVESALTFVGYRAHWQTALADLMALIQTTEPPLPAPALPPPVGWSAWYHHGVATDEQIARGVTDFIAANWRSHGYRYINLDAGWNRAEGDTRADPVKFPRGIESLVAYIHERGLLAGGYFVPFAIAPMLLDQQAPGTTVRYRDMLVRDAAGAPIRASILDWDYVLDTTHPEAEAFLYASARRLVDYGFDFVKLDFLQIGTQEGVRHDRDATAMEAFHRGMRAITRAWQDAGRPIFISAAISPLYIQPYVHARRVGNDVEFGQARQAANVALSWFTGLLYHRNDPDNAVLRRTWYPGYNDALAKLHATMSALGGTLFLAGDDPRELSPARAALLTNPWVLGLTRQPLQVRPLSVRETPAPVWHGPAPDGMHVVAVFNWDGARGARHTIRFQDLGLADRAVYRLFDLWENTEKGNHEHSFTIDLPPHGVVLLYVTRVG